MFQDKYVFAQLVSFFNRSKFNRIVSKYNGDKYVKHFTCWNQLLALMFGQLSNRESLRDLINALDAHHSKCYHLGMGKNVSRSSLARANQDRDYHIFEEFAYYLVNQAREKRVSEIFKLEGNVYAFDSTTIDLCLSVFWWAKFRKKKGGIKVHTLYDVETQIPTFFHITTASEHDSKAMKEIPYEPESYYVFDRAYNNFKMLYKIHQIEAFFVIRAKKNLQYKSVKWKRRLPKNILSDVTIELTGFYPKQYYPKYLRLVKYWDEEQKREFIFLTNAVQISALQVAELYRNRWQVELFFKWLKQHLRVKKFWGTTENAVRIQLYVAISTYCLVAIVQKDMQLDRSTYEILQILSISLTDKTQLKDLFNKTKFQNNKERNRLNEPSLFDF
ncbi:IS4 family transposase [Myroides marinus]|uniref:IS4 family transposase n=5 Tax=Myroides marinus TaxID=703342 RepID=UPI0025776CDA|nr:IS4 family transposase [Myroides marinus]MDM1347225.1 IS4 family transposase [Myroides marinus]MDM1352606.1 IS4 family transposase [Myroides marinus]MDM1354110.1 IS4 family transposase [Myroides marinus]MDM1359812.1 IS4 family transposase [Myroides marinus]MDM1381058.1 IS4 family transposase [Myroides marinus]